MSALKEEISKPTVTKEEILYYLTKYRKLNMKQLDHRRRLIDSFVNAIYLFDDYLVITFNYKEGTKTITFAEIEEAFGSDLSSLTAPTKKRTFVYRQRCVFLNDVCLRQMIWATPNDDGYA